MIPAFRRLQAPLTILLSTLAWPVLADSSVSSAVSDSVSTSVGSISGSIQNSSNSSSRGDRVAAGDYKVVGVAAVPSRPGDLAVTLQALADAGPAGELLLTLPQASADEGRLAPGQLVTAWPRPYGVEFARADDRRPFFLVLTDDWYRELQTRLVRL